MSRLVLVLLLAACTPKGPPESAFSDAARAEAAAGAAAVATPALPQGADPDPQWSAYIAAVEAARFPTPDKVVDDLLPLTPDAPGVQWDDAGRVLVSSWSKAQYFDGYQKGKEFGLYGETWFTAGTQVQDVCRASGLTGEALDLRLEQLLGLPPGGTYDVFLQVWVHPDDLFRPCADPSVTSTSCPIAPPLTSSAPDQVAWACGGKDAPGLSARALASDPAAPEDPAAARRARWLCDTWAARYGVSDARKAYPWTALGYTLDWGREGGFGPGPSELVASAGTKAIFERIVPTGAFCAPVE